VVQLPVSPTLPIETERLQLRAFGPADLDSLVAIQGDPEAVRYVPYGPRDRSDLAPVLERKITGTTLRDSDDRLELAVVRRDTGELIGDVLLAVRGEPEHGVLEVGYIFAATHGGHGFATEAVRALLDLAFGELGARRVIARVDTRNTASLKLLDRIGLRQEALLVENEYFKGELSSEADFAILAREWPR
jgi:RimJ/RimL family protein N-acetyltransferase